MEQRQMVFDADFKVRENDEQEKFIEGYFIRYNEETELFQGMYEEIKPEAITNSLLKNDVRCLFNHDSAVVLGRTGNGTLELKSDSQGLWGKVKINQNDKQANDIYARVQRGDINACSFGFVPLDEDVEYRDDGSVKFIVRDVDLKEVSPVTFPAYPTTSVQVRKKDFNDHQKRKLDLKKAKLKERLNNGTKTTNASKKD